MNLVSRSFAMVSALAVVGAVTLCAADAPDFQRHKAPPKRMTGVTFTEPDAPAVNTNSTYSTLQKPTLGTLQETIRKPFEVFQPEDALNGVIRPPVRRLTPPPLINKRAEARRERQKNWVFSTPEEIYGLQSAEEMMDIPEFGPDGELRKPKTTFERYLERLESTRANTATNQASSDQLPPWMKPTEGDDNSDDSADKTKPADDTGPAKSLFGDLGTDSRRPVTLDYGSTLGNAGTAGSEKSGEGLFNFSSPSVAEKPAAQDAARELRMQEFRRMLDSRSLAGSSLGASPILTAPSPVTPLSSSPYGADSFASPPVSRSATLPTITSTPSTPSYYTTPSIVAPTPPPPRSITPVSSFELPKRKY